MQTNMKISYKLKVLSQEVALGEDSQFLCTGGSLVSVCSAALVTDPGLGVPRESILEYICSLIIRLLVSW